MKEGAVSEVELVLYGLEPVGSHLELFRKNVGGWAVAECEVGEWWCGLRRPHVRPQHSALLHHWVGGDSLSRLRGGVVRDIRHVDALPVHVELPTVVDAPQSALLVAAKL